MPARTLLPVPSSACLQPAQLAPPSPVVAVAAREAFSHPHTPRWSVLYVLGLLDTFSDEDVKHPEASRPLRESLAKQKEIAASGLPVLLTVSAPKEPGRDHFLQEVASQADLYWEPLEHVPRLPAPRQLARGIG